MSRDGSHTRSSAGPYGAVQSVRCHAHAGVSLGTPILGDREKGAGTGCDLVTRLSLDPSDIGSFLLSNPMHAHGPKSMLAAVAVRPCVGGVTEQVEVGNRLTRRNIGLSG
jgi:hypothetical protein